MGNPATRIPFICPICGADEFSQVYITNKEGVPRWTQAYQCRGCTTMFRDAAKFTARRIQRDDDSSP